MPSSAPLPRRGSWRSRDAGLVVRREAETDGEGRARIAGLPVRGTIALGVDADGFAPWRRTKLSAREAPVVATLERGAQVLGRVVDPWGARWRTRG